ncbi:PTS mannose/fructose/sorbose/N-acetylgalactosamine transporter subunit IIC [Traorella massiliensis]|uniref:PTS mannose/fructose/sorbose/N-acetylgalactosamine transporter subunit IIC n=1 Tax=Traorella massiliensis TaxID=1903263 RepID=UPI0023536204|nr:PTS sugar transporter subunit IIC [Traorella massiliensis]
MSIIQAILVGLVYYCGSSFWLNGYLTITRPFVAATLVGVIMGDPTKGAIIGANIQMIYMGWMSVGGSQPTDACLAGTLATAFAIGSGLDTNVALAMAAPLGLIGSIVWIGRNTMNVFVLHLADKIAAKGKWKQLTIVNTFVPQIILLCITFVPVSLAAYFGVSAVSGIINYISDNVLGILSNIGGVLPAVGIALNMKVIMKKSLVPYFFFGFFLSAYFNLSLVGIAAVFIGVAALYMFNQEANREGI